MTISCSREFLIIVMHLTTNQSYRDVIWIKNAFAGYKGNLEMFRPDWKNLKLRIPFSFSFCIRLKICNSDKTYDEISFKEMTIAVNLQIANWCDEPLRQN